MPLLPRETAASWRLPKCPQNICVDIDVTLFSKYTTIAGAASRNRFPNSTPAALRSRPSFDKLRSDSASSSSELIVSPPPDAAAAAAAVAWTLFEMILGGGWSDERRMATVYGWRWWSTFS
ncbi:unnamed protein product [Cuscuta campestris]|uniref:Uncharacterized protein n=1 Tax=Cuscuta campestris TaxID=132261 RepID=A0A484JZU9_9ASTE|nr:unnamed protein product [Cuscuta campestris]